MAADLPATGAGAMAGILVIDDQASMRRLIFGCSGAAEPIATVAALLADTAGNTG